MIDMQKDFVSGSLGTAEAQAVVGKVVAKVAGHKGLLAYTLDTHEKDYLETSEGKHLPVPHCIKGEEGHQLVDQLKEPLKDAMVFEKPTFGSIELATYIAEDQTITEVELVGVCTDICVVSNALLIKAMRPEIPILVDASCCAGTTPGNHEAAIKTMQSCQIEIFS
ncbi:cysteine hydrolase family protein [Sphaerochaeta sp.]|uniref:cysteine hydrolase family protein n=1 Tax=Sphaerochaeta sp. TaxID=1972642 RepID=UPI003D0ACCED